MSRFPALRRVITAPGTPRARLALAGLLGLASAAATIGLLAGSGYVVGRAALRPGLDALVGILASIEVLAFLRGPLRYAERLIGHDAALRALTQWRLWLYDCLADRVPAAFASWRSGDLLTRAVDDVDALGDLYLRTLLPVVVAVAAAILGTVVEGLVLPVAALALGIPLALAMIVPAALILGRANHDSNSAALAGQLTARVVDVIHGAPDLIAFGADGDAFEQLTHLADQADGADRRVAATARAATLIVQLCLGAALVAVLAVTVAAVHAHHLDRVMVAVLPLTVLGTFEPVPLLSAALSRALSVERSADRLFQLGDVPVPVSDPATPATLGSGVPAVRADGASLRYAPDLPLVLDGVSLDLPAGASLAVTGSSGAGKSSLINSLLRFWPLESGHIEVNGGDAGRFRQSDVRALFALVDQSAHLFGGTLRANLTLGRPDAGEDEITAALAAAQLDEWVAGLPEGLETQVGDDGTAISGGERRRVAVARALIAGRDVLLLDEPGSGLDAPTADHLLASVVAAAAERGQSLLLITHRAAEAERCDQVVRLVQGRIVKE
ncbi:MAG TPA: thiol reductant ABC exporter subunit CydC [Acidimicrobiales bacterium]|jgi:thiol reductant ABC exporter CydC subunit